MKKLKILFLIIFLLLINIVNVNAKEYIKDGWHLVEPYTGNKLVWGYYENGTEIMRKTRMIFVHRGWGTEPENSLMSFQVAKDLGYYGFETDVRFTKDNVAVLCHDGRINRITTDENNIILNYLDPIKVSDLTFEELKKYRFNVTSSYDVLSEQKYVNNTITTFEEALIFAKQNKMIIYIELKDGTEEQVRNLVNMVKSYDMDNVVIWNSFYPNLLEYVKNTDDDEIMIVGSDYQSDLTPMEIYNLLKTDNNLVNVNGENGKKDIQIKGAPIIDLPKKMSDDYVPDYYYETPRGLVQIRSLRVVNNPNKIVYTQNKDNLDLNGGLVEITYLNNTTEIVNMSDARLTISDLDNSKLGTQTININYIDEATSFDVEVTDISEIKVKNEPTKKSYLQYKETLDLSGGKLDIVYLNGDIKEIDMSDSNITIEGFNNGILGKQNITLKYKDFTTSFEIEVVNISELNILNLPTKLTYKQNDEELILNDGELDATYTNGEKYVINMSDPNVIVEGYDNTKLGKQTIILKYMDLLVSFEVEVVNVKEIRIKNKPEKLTYIINKDELDLSSGSIEIIYTNGDTYELSMDDSNICIEGFDNSKLGKQTITIKYFDYQDTFEIDIIKKNNNSKLIVISILVISILFIIVILIFLITHKKSRI